MYFLIGVGTSAIGSIISQSADATEFDVHSCRLTSEDMLRTSTSHLYVALPFNVSVAQAALHTASRVGRRLSDGQPL